MSGDARQQANAREAGIPPRSERAQLSGLEVQAAGVHAVAQAVRAGAVVEDVTEMTTAAAAHDLGALHAELTVGLRLDRFRHQRLGEARPAGARLELRVRVEQLGATTRAAVDAVVVTVPVLPENARSVPAFRSTSYCSGPNSAFHSSGVFSISRVATMPPDFLVLRRMILSRLGPTIRYATVGR